MGDGADDDEDASGEARRVEFTPAELEVLSKACRRYRTSLPVYLRDAQPELALIESVLKKIA